MRPFGRLHFLAAAAALGSFNRIDGGYQRPGEQADEHVNSYRWHLYKLKVAMINAEREALKAQQIAAKRERDKPWIDAAEAKRARKRAKAAALAERGK